MSQRKRLSKAARRRRQRNRRIAMFIVGLLIVGAVWFGILLFLNGRKEDSAREPITSGQENEPEATGTPVPTETPTPEPLPAVDMSGINSTSGILVRLSDGQTVAEKDADVQIYPASMTKMMTAIVAIENLSDLNQTITLSQELFAPLYEEGASMAGFAPGDQVTAMDLLYGVILPSGAECCLGLAEQIAGSESAFADMMNAKAQELGMTATHFVTSTGLHDPEHYTTVRDLTKLMTYALQNYEYRDVFDESPLPVLPVENGQYEELGIGEEAVTALSYGVPAGELSLDLLLKEDEQVEVVRDLPQTLAAPVRQGQQVGCVRYLLNGQVLKEYPVFAERTVEEKDFAWCLRKVEENYRL